MIISETQYVKKISVFFKEFSLDDKQFLLKIVYLDQTMVEFHICST